MDKEKAIKKTRGLLGEVSGMLSNQLDEYKKKTNSSIPSSIWAGQKYLTIDGIAMPYNLAIARIHVCPENFLFLLFDNFQRLYRLASDNIENPLVQFTMRPLLELCYGKIIYFVLQDNNKQKDLATKSWLCCYGMILEGGRKHDSKYSQLYRNLIPELSKEEDQSLFNAIEKRQFPLKEITRVTERIFPSIRVRPVAIALEPYLTEIWGVKFKKEYLENILLWLSQYIHANIFLLQNLEREKKEKTHVFRSATILFLIGYHFLDFTNKKILFSKKEMKKLKSEIAQLLPELRKACYLNHP